MGLDFAIAVKLENGRYYDVTSDFNAGVGSRYFGMYEGKLYDKGQWLKIQSALIEAHKKCGVVYYGHDHIDYENYQKVDADMLAEISKLYMDS